MGPTQIDRLEERGMWGTRQHWFMLVGKDKGLWEQASYHKAVYKGEQKKPIDLWKSQKVLISKFWQRIFGLKYPSKALALRDGIKVKKEKASVASNSLRSPATQTTKEGGGKRECRTMMRREVFSRLASISKKLKER